MTSAGAQDAGLTFRGAKPTSRSLLDETGELTIHPSDWNAFEIEGFLHEFVRKLEFE